LFESGWQDLCHGARLLRLNPGFFTVATLSLTLGIGANTAIFQLLDALAVGRAATSMLFGLQPSDPMTIGAAVAGLAMVAVAASLLPAIRAARVEPMVALREE
jgi:ABC-type antimicrobial peptide transport system permease subunit